MPQTRVVLFRGIDGCVPLYDWLDQQSVKVRAKCIGKIRRLAAMGHELRRPEVDLLRNGIYELRVGYSGQNYRMLYFFHSTVAVVISHGLTKERVVPPIEVERAIQRRALYLSNPTTHTQDW